MSPEAKAGYAAPTARVPRTLYEHGHYEDSSVDVSFPPQVYSGYDLITLAHLPDNWTGFDEFYLKFLSGYTGNFDITIKIDAGTCDESPTTHTQTVAGHTVALVDGEYECIDLMTIFATVIALMQSDDNIRIEITTTEEWNVWYYGVVIEES